ncbi:DgyrCDS3231 [Dimorphilus gyrociliatus]|nr:DgyrCDS3231 [Dimorphilus gyrociliatus]
MAVLTSTTNHCWLKHQCENYQQLVNYGVHHNLIDNQLSCFIGGMDQSVDSVYTTAEKTQAITYAVANDKVVVFSATNIELKTGDLNNLNKEYDKTTCFAGNLMINEIDNIKTFLTNHAMFDKQLTTCKTITSTPLKIRFPWPTSGSANHNFSIRIDGENLNCYNSRILTLTGSNIIVYVPLDHQINAVFEGNYLSCDLQSVNATSCNFSCNCRGKKCQAVYVNSQDYEERMKICEITKIL